MKKAFSSIILKIANLKKLITSIKHFIAHIVNSMIKNQCTLLHIFENCLISGCRFLLNQDWFHRECITK